MGIFVLIQESHPDFPGATNIAKLKDKTMNFDLLSLKNAKGKMDNAGIASMKVELERRRESNQKLSAEEKARVSSFIKSNMKLVDEGKPFHTTLQRLLGYVQKKA